MGILSKLAGVARKTIKKNAVVNFREGSQNAAAIGKKIKSVKKPRYVTTSERDANVQRAVRMYDKKSFTKAGTAVKSGVKKANRNEVIKGVGKTIAKVAKNPGVGGGAAGVIAVAAYDKKKTADANKAKVNANKVAVNAAKVNANTFKNYKNEEKVAENTRKVAENKTKVQNNAVKVYSNATKVNASKASNASSNAQKVAANKAKVEANKKKVAANAAKYK
jgi:hypothetical protein